VKTLQNTRCKGVSPPLVVLARALNWLEQCGFVLAASPAAYHMPSMPVIFLDVDGVLHPTVSDAFFSSGSMQSLRTIIEATGSRIVLSSMWQSTAEGRRDVDEALRRWGLPPCIARTVRGTPGSGEEKRAREITTWVRANRDACSGGWIALDDLDVESVANPPSWAPLIPPGHALRTNANVGLTHSDAVRAIQMLGGRNPAAPALAAPHPDPGLPRLRHEEARAGRSGHEVWKTDARYGGDGAFG
jgi:hypothetical protein